MLMVLGLTCLAVVLLLLYLIKSALGINLFEDKHLSDFIPFLGITVAGGIRP